MRGTDGRHYAVPGKPIDDGMFKLKVVAFAGMLLIAPYLEGEWNLIRRVIIQSPSLLEGL